MVSYMLVTNFVASPLPIGADPGFCKGEGGQLLRSKVTDVAK